MKRVNAVIAAATGYEAVKFQDLGMDAQVSVVYNSLQLANSTRKLIQSNIDAPNAAPQYVAQAELTIANLDHSITSMAAFLFNAATITEAGSTHIDFDDASPNIDTGTVEGDVHSEYVATSRAPYAWARDRIVAAGIVEAEWEPPSVPLALYNPARVAEQAFGRYIGRHIVQLAEGSIFTPQRQDARDITIFGLSPSIVALSTCKSRKVLCRQILEFAMARPPYIGNKAYNKVDLAKAWQTLEELDEDDAEEAAMKADVKEIRQAVRYSVRTQLLLDQVTHGVEQLKKAGASEAAIAAFVANTSGLIMPKAEEPAPAATN